MPFEDLCELGHANGICVVAQRPCLTRRRYLAPRILVCLVAPDLGHELVSAAVRHDLATGLEEIREFSLASVTRREPTPVAS